MTDLDILCAVESQNVDKIMALVNCLKEQRDVLKQMGDLKNYRISEAIDFLEANDPDSAYRVLINLD